MAAKLHGYGYQVHRSSFAARTTAGTRTVQNVLGVLPGSGNASIVVVAHRDAQSSPATAELSGTAVLLELARVLAGETVRHTIVLASTSGSAGAVGAARLASGLPGPVDAVLVLGDLAAARPSGPLVDPWARGRVLAPPRSGARWRARSMPRRGRPHRPTD